MMAVDGMDGGRRVARGYASDPARVWRTSGLTRNGTAAPAQEAGLATLPDR